MLDIFSKNDTRIRKPLSPYIVVCSRVTACVCVAMTKYLLQTGLCSAVHGFNYKAMHRCNIYSDLQVY